MTNIARSPDGSTSRSDPAGLIALDHLGLIYDTVDGPLEAIRDVSLTIAKGEFVAVIGPSGCGKSTMLRAIAGLRRVSRGAVLFDGAPVLGPLSSVGMVFQSPVLLPWRRIIDNVLIAAERAQELLDLTGLGEFTRRYPRELSGGMQQRVSLCRALLLDPPVLLMDEPFGALDAMTRDEMNLELLRVWGQESPERKTIVFVTHSINEAIFLADRVVIMAPRPGRIAQIFDVRLPRPRTVEQRASAEFGELSLQIYQALKAAPPGSTAL